MSSNGEISNKNVNLSNSIPSSPSSPSPMIMGGNNYASAYLSGNIINQLPFPSNNPIPSSSSSLSSNHVPSPSSSSSYSTLDPNRIDNQSKSNTNRSKRATKPTQRKSAPSIHASPPFPSSIPSPLSSPSSPFVNQQTYLNSLMNSIYPQSNISTQHAPHLNPSNAPYFNPMNQFIDPKSLNAYSNITSTPLGQNLNQPNSYPQSPIFNPSFNNGKHPNPFLNNDSSPTSDTSKDRIPMRTSNNTIIRRTTSQPVVSMSKKASKASFDAKLNEKESASGATYLIVDRRGVIISAKNTNSFGHSSHSLENQQFIALLCDPYKQLFQLLLSGYFMNGKYESVLFSPMVVELNTIIRNGHGSNPGSPLLLGSERIEWIRQNIESSTSPKENSQSDSSNYLAKITVSTPNPETSSNQMDASKGENHLKDSVIVVFEKYEESSAFITTDGSGIIISTRSTESSFGLSNSECSRKTISFLLPFYDFASQVNGKNENKATNVLGKNANGNLFWASMVRSTINVSGNFVLHQFQLTSFDNSNEAILLVNEDEHITRTSVFSLHFLFGLTPLELIGQPLSNWLTRKGSKSIIQLLQDENSPTNQDRKKRKKSGTEEQETSETLEESKDHVKCIKTQFKHSDGTQVPVLVQIFPCSFAPRNRHLVKSSTASNTDSTNQSTEISNNQSDPFNNSIASENGYQFTHAYCLKIKRISSEESTKQSIDKYVFLEDLGRGAFSKVKRAVDTTTKSHVAIKIITKPKLSEEDLQRAHRETQIMMKLNHQHIVKLYKTIETPKKLYLILEFVPGCDLMTYVIEKKGLSETESKEIFVQLISALLYCHQNKVIHRDVKHKNILIDKSSKQIKLIDFGLSNWNEEGTMKTSYCGTPAFASPEMVLGHEYDGSLVDVWSAAVVLYSMLTAKFPFSNVGELISGTFEDPPNVSKDCCDLIRSMLVVSPQNRSSLLQVSGHSWCKSHFQT